MFARRQTQPASRRSFSGVPHVFRQASPAGFILSKRCFMLVLYAIRSTLSAIRYTLHAIQNAICYTLYAIRYFIMQNKPNSPAALMNVSNYFTTEYEQIDTWSSGKNKPNSNPIRTQSNPISQQPKMNESLYPKKGYENEPCPRSPRNKPNQTQFSSHLPPPTRKRYDTAGQQVKNSETFENAVNFDAIDRVMTYDFLDGIVTRVCILQIPHNPHRPFYLRWADMCCIFSQVKKNANPSVFGRKTMVTKKKEQL